MAKVNSWMYSSAHVKLGTAEEQFIEMQPIIATYITY